MARRRVTVMVSYTVHPGAAILIGFHEQDGSRMNTCVECAEVAPEEVPAAWPAVFAMALGTFALVTAEFLPASLLTPMASSLGVTEGMAGQTVTVTALIALVTSLFISVLTRNIDRRVVLLSFSVLLVASNLLVAF